MSESKFTKGPWEIYTGETFGPGPNDWNPIAVYCDVHSKRTTIATFRVGFPHGDDQQRSNARLIASAPETHEEAAFLLERLATWANEHITDDNFTDWNGHVAPSIARLTAILKKAGA